MVGGTGMLRRVSRTLALKHTVAVVSRGGERMEALRAKAPAIIPVAVDWRRTRDLERALWKVVDRLGAFALCVAWIHSDAPKAPEAVAQFVQGRYYHVLGSEAADPSDPDPERRARFQAMEDLTYHEVILGFVRQGAGSRWLTEDEITRGVLTAIAWAKPRTVVGTVRPWGARPS
jgi:hypothetical protein